MSFCSTNELYALIQVICLHPYPVAQKVKRLSAMQKTCVQSWVGKIPRQRKWQPSPVLLPGKSHGWRRLVGYSLWGHKESDSTE